MYRNLNILVDQGEIRRLESSRGRDRFDARMPFHAHFTCTVCGRIVDLPVSESDLAEARENAAEDGHRITGHMVEFTGICADCTEAEVNTQSLLALVFILVFSALALLLWYWKTRTDELRGSRERTREDFDDRSGGSDCPLCGEHLPRGTRVHSVVYPGREFDLMRIYGCPYCWAGHAAPTPGEHLHSRRCPYCGDSLPEDGYVMARVYHKPYRKTHVNVYGCTVCKPGRG